MLYFLIVLIAVVLSAGVSFAIRQLDKNENSMEKVKRYAEKRQSEFDVYFKAQAEKLSVESSDLETGRIQAVAGVKRLQQQYDDFEKMTKNLDKQIGRVNKIEEKIASYDKVVRNLMEMTVAVEQNLQKVKKEADVVDKLNERLGTQEKGVDSIDKKIPDITKKFAATNVEQLKALGTDLLGQYGARANKIEDSTSKALEQNKEVLAKIKAEISAAYTDAASRAKTLQDAAFAQLESESTARSNDLMKELTVRAKQLSSEMDAKIKDVQKNLNAQASTFNGSISDQTASLSSSLSERITSLTADLNKKVDELDASIK